MASLSGSGSGSVTETRSRVQYGAFRDTTVLVAGFAPEARDALVGQVQALGGNTQTRFHERALPHVVVCGTTNDESFRVRARRACAAAASGAFEKQRSGARCSTAWPPAWAPS